MGGPLGRDVKRILMDNGCSFVRHGKGDHEIWYSPLSNRNVALDMGTRKRFTANTILKQAGVKERL